MAEQDDLQQEGAFRSLGDAPADGMLVVGRLANGERHLMRWRSPAIILKEDGPDDQREPYWARWHTDKAIHPVEWAPTRLTIEDVLDWV
ncbi:hypothetical protein C3941_17980 [Kaistia algarum]|uniref:hypothetical protein n=1 Tax=Kaistia algarum TaxID=2083279 RepID=UPI000CE7464A|nr:hypothetical protein [Kaistia algarum]MCX5516761.1 hypothetical protein [Kaistia algarum]PPE78652.1 hypothetical protein C3941_17980 [Kaistia algarum]